MEGGFKMPRSQSWPQNQLSLAMVYAMVRYSASVLKREIMGYFFDIQGTRFRPRQRQEPDIDGWSSGLLVQLESTTHSKCRVCRWSEAKTKVKCYPWCSEEYACSPSCGLHVGFAWSDKPDSMRMQYLAMKVSDIVKPHQDFDMRWYPLKENMR